MPNIPLTNKIHTVTSGVDTVNKGSAQANAGREAYTIQDLADTIGGGVSSIIAGDGITVDEEGGDVTVNAKIGGPNADDYITKFNGDDSVAASKIYCNTFTSGGVTYENYIFGGAAAPTLATFPEESMILIETQPTAPTSAATAGFAGQVILYHGDENDADNGIYVCIAAGAAGAAKWTKSSLTNV